MSTHQATHHGPITVLSDVLGWLRGATTARHVEAARTALDRVDHTLDRLDDAGHLVTCHLENHDDRP